MKIILKTILICMLPALASEAGAGELPYSTATDTLAASPTLAAIDTLAPVQREIPEFKRKIESTVFIPKGQWGAGISVSYSQTNQSKYQFLIIENLNGDTYSFKVSPMVCYFVKNDMGLGGRFSYSRSLTKLEHGDIVIDSETEYNIENLYRLSHTYSFTGIMRNYFSLGKSKRFGFFNEMQLEIGGGQSKLMKGKNEELTGAYTRDFHFNIGFAPGLVMFLNNYTALEVNVGVLGFGITSTKQIDDRIYESHRKSESANFRVNLFSITFGTTFYL